jgi:hypothetical protein
VANEGVNYEMGETHVADDELTPGNAKKAKSSCPEKGKRVECR